MLLANMNWLGVLCKTLPGVKDCVKVKKVNICGSYPQGWGGVGGLCEIFLIELTMGYVVGKNEMAMFAV